MSALVLTVMLAVIWALVVALGYWHGGWRQVIALAGILLSYAVLSEWAGPNGRDLADAFGWGLARTITGVALAYLIGGAAILGYLGSMLFPRPYPIASRERLVGALVGVLNGGLMLSLALRVLRAYTFVPGKGKALHESPLARFLIEEIGYVLIAAFVAGIGAIVAGFVLSLRRTAAQDATMTEGATEPLPAPASVQPVISPVSTVEPALAAPANSDPYTAAPVIDWPTTPPPGMPVAAPVVGTAAVAPPPEQPVPARAPVPPLALPKEPRVPARVPPPMWYPVETLMSGTGKESPAATVTSPTAAVAAAPPPSSPSSPSAPPAPAIPAMPPPGAPVVASPPSEPPAAPEPGEEPVVVRELDLQTRDSVPMASPDASASEAKTVEEIPAMGPAAAESQSERLPDTDMQPAEMPAPAKESRASDASREQAERSPVPASVPEPPATVPPSRAEASVAATAAFPTMTPPPLPPVPPPMPGQSDMPRARGTYARVAQTRQPGVQPPAPAPQPPQSPDAEQPLHPPIPTGPDIRPCPTCGYPVRPHARFCPNCGHRLAR